MARALRKSAVASAALLSGRSPRHGWKRSSAERSYSAASAAMSLCVEEEPEFGSWELPLPVLQDMTSGQKTGRGPQWVFLGSPGVGKSTYATRLAKLLNVPHISMGSLLHNEASKSTTFGKELALIMRQGKLVPDDIIFSVLSKRFEQKIKHNESGFIIDGFPRTLTQAEILDEVAEIDLVVNLKLREDMLRKHMDRCCCTECGSSFCDSKQNCHQCSTCKALTLVPGAANMMEYMSLLRDRLKTHSIQCKPVEYHYRKRGKLLDLDVAGGIPKTWPRLLSALRMEDAEIAVQQHQLPI